MSRAKMFLRRDLAWMTGYPNRDGHWMMLPDEGPAVEIPLDRKLLRRSTRTMNMLLRDFPRALPRLVGDTKRWATVHKALLDTLKPAIHQQASPPAHPLENHPFLTQALRRTRDALRARGGFPSDLLTAFQWYGYRDDRELLRALRWCERHGELLAILADRLPERAARLSIRLWQLEASNPRKLTTAYALLGDPAAWENPLEIAGEFFDSTTSRLASNKSPVPPKPKPGLPGATVEWIEWLATQDRACRRRGLRLFELLINLDQVSEWESWWDELYDIHRTSVTYSRRKTQERIRASQVRKLKMRLRHAHQNVPAAIPAQMVRELLKTLAHSSQVDIYNLVSRRLGKVPVTLAGAAARLAIARHWQKLCMDRHYWSERAAHLQRQERLLYVRRVFDYLQSHRFSEQAIAPWMPVIAGMQPGRRGSNVDAEVMAQLDSRGKIETYFAIASERSLWDKASMTLLSYLVSDLEPAQARMAFEHWDDPAIVDYTGASSARLACRLTKKYPERFSKTLAAIDSVYITPQELLDDTIAAFESARLGGALVDAVDAGNLPALLSAAAKLTLARQQGLSTPGVYRRRTRSPAWTKRYPVALQPALARLASCDREAERTAGRLLARDVPAEGSLNNEIDRLELLATPTAAQEKRLENLRRRLQKPVALSPKRQANLERKLEAARIRRVVAQWVESIEPVYAEAMSRYLRRETLPDWVRNARFADLMADVLKLDSDTRALARQILVARTEPGPWDFRQQPANRRFIRQMIARDIDLSAWLDPGFEREEIANDGLRLRLAIERDPLEIIEMGAHFNTCLSPGDINFFSVFANIGDVNKQVVYARDDGGRVFGRVLLALTEHGGLLQFHPYAHSQSTGFDEIAARFTQALAQRMGSIVVTTGHVPCLFARNWYDDGPVDIACQHPLFADGASLRDQIPTLTADRFLGILKKDLAPAALNGLTLPLVIELPELDQRPDLLLPLLSVAQRVSLPGQTLLRLAELVLPIASQTQGRTLLRRVLRDTLGGKSGRRAYYPARVIALFQQYAPGFVLQLLRSTRPAGVRRWSDEPDGLRLAAAAAASAALHRPRKAIELYELALAADGRRAEKTLWRQALRQLTATTRSR